MSHLLASQGVQPRDHQEYIGNTVLGPKMSPQSPHTPIGGMFSASHTQQLDGSLMSMSFGCQNVASGSNIGNVSATYSPCTTDMPQLLGGFSVADIYSQPTSPFGNCPSILDATVGAPTPLFMNIDSFNVNPPLASANSWATGMSDSTAMDTSTSMPGQAHNMASGFPHM
ncbi:hypothetical protein GGI24_001147 [Coemansia furcata]|nr:hypothetical protein GGI24_001147 [Coemansia furcata]